MGYKENSEFKTVKLRLKIDLVSYPARAEGLVYIYIYIYIYIYESVIGPKQDKFLFKKERKKKERKQTWGNN